jgi:hypothetical protein
VSTSRPRPTKRGLLACNSVGFEPVGGHRDLPVGGHRFLSGGHHGARSVVAEKAVHEPAIDDGRVGGRAGVEPHRAPYGQRPMVDSKALMRWRMSPSRSRTTPA